MRLKNSLTKLISLVIIFNLSQVGATSSSFSSHSASSGNTFSTGYWETAAESVVLNEFLPNPIGDDHAPKPNGEWVELYNNGDLDHDLTGWKLKDGADRYLDITGTITAKGFLVVYLDGAFGNNGWLNNSGGDSVTLYDSIGTEIDSYTYGNDAAAGKSYARFPDGTGAWHDPVPTPGEPNSLEELEEVEEITEAVEEEEEEEPVEEEPVQEEELEEDQPETVEETQQDQNDGTIGAGGESTANPEESQETPSEPVNTPEPIIEIVPEENPSENPEPTPIIEIPEIEEPGEPAEEEPPLIEEEEEEEAIEEEKENEDIITEEQVSPTEDEDDETI